MLQALFQRIEIVWWDIMIATLTRIASLRRILRYLYRLWKRYKLNIHLRFLLLAAVGGFLTGMIVAQITAH